VTPERIENNKKVAEWLGFRYDQEGDENHPAQWHHPTCQCKAKEPDELCACVEGCYWGDDAGGQPPDFYSEETANAMVLEKMPCPTLMRTTDRWICDANAADHLADTCRSDLDRKTAICEAAVKLIELEGK
jgi:hypothetical protein